MKTLTVKKRFGDKWEKMAAAIGTTRQNIALWGDTIPRMWQYKIYIITDGKLKPDKGAMAEIRRRRKVIKGL